jgi:peptide/nickel transport system substrate-binding protein/microcin C transport system substrate-binding protein
MRAMSLSRARRQFLFRSSALAALCGPTAGVLRAAHSGGSAAAAAAPARLGVWTHGYAAFGEPAYPRDFDHFSYADPNAPKGGTLYLKNPDRRSSFDKFNPFTVKGNAPAGVVIWMFEPLAILAGDETLTMYGLLAQEMLIAPDKSSITFRLHPRARFHNGDAVTAADVKHSFDEQAGPYADPGSQSALAAVEQAVVLDERTLRFDLKARSNDTLFTVGTLRVFSRKWGLQADGKRARFDEIVSDYPITSGPYTIAEADSGRRLVFKRNPDYWARELGLRRGCFNFDTVVYRYYLEMTISREAFKAGEFDIFREYGARSWVRQHKGPKWDDGRIVKDPFDNATGQGLQSYQLNLRRPLFQDIRVREALGYTYDFETLNRLKQFKRCNSLFNNSEFAAAGLPSPGELALLEPFRAELPPRVFGTPFVAPVTDMDPKKLRANLLAARALLEQAGWKIAADGRLRNAKGEAFEFEYMVPGEGRRMPEWEGNLEKLGIKLKIRDVDFALYRRRLEEYDFDVVTIAGTDFTLPDAAGLTTTFGSKAADEKGNNNLRGVKSAAVDAILKALGAASTLQELRDASRALDRVVMWSHWQVPDLYSADEKASYWNRFGMPATRPKYFLIDTTSSDYPPWPLMTWWIKDAAKR